MTYKINRDTNPYFAFAILMAHVYFRGACYLGYVPLEAFPYGTGKQVHIEPLLMLQVMQVMKIVLLVLNFKMYYIFSRKAIKIRFHG
jgi:hypothetical protein